MKMFFLNLLCMWHDWRVAVWESRQANPKLSEELSHATWERWHRGCEIMRQYHDRRFQHLQNYFWAESLAARKEIRP